MTRLFPEVPNSRGSNLLKDIIWIASASTPFAADHSPSLWLKTNHDTLPSIWMAMIQDEFLWNNSKISSK